MQEFLRKIRKQFAFGLLSRGIAIPAPFVERYAEMIYLKELLDDLEIDCVLDVGANTGQFAQDLRLIGYRGQIISFEPLSDAYAVLEREFAGDKNWTGMQIALGRTEGTADFNVGCDTKYSSFLEFRDKGAVARSEKVTVRRLDSVFSSMNLAEVSSGILLKMDTQGYDAEVFAGAKSCISRIHAIMSEISVIPIYGNMQNYKSALVMYEQAGFNLSGITTVSRTEKGHIIEMNCLLKR